MIKTLLFVMALPLMSHANESLDASGCPELRGHYPKCHSEIKEMKGEYVVEQSNEKGVEIYHIKYIDDDGSVQEDEFKTDGSNVTRKQKIPTIGIKVKVEGSATCKENNVFSTGEAYFMGAHVGGFDTTIFKDQDNTLTMKIKADYLGKSVNKLIQCKE
jgi:hypothetical protein